MTRNDVIQESYKRISSSGLLQTKLVPISSLGNILEYTGKLLMGLTYNETQEHGTLVDTLINGVIEYILKEDNRYIIPRTVYIGVNDPNEQERKGKQDRWEKVNNTVPALWYRTDTSYSQLTYLLQGIYRFEPELVKSITNNIYDNNWQITRIDGKPAENGNYNTPFPNIQLRKYYMKELVDKDHNLLEHLCYFITKYFIGSGSDSLNSVLIYYSILQEKGISDNFKGKLKEVISKYLVNYKKDTAEFQGRITWLLIDRMRREIL